MKKLIPNTDRILVVPLERDLQSQGIILPETSTEEQIVGIVSASGPDAHSKEGDLVIFGIYAGIQIELEGRPFIIMRQEEILGTIVETSIPDSTGYSYHDAGHDLGSVRA